VLRNETDYERVVSHEGDVGRWTLRRPTEEEHRELVGSRRIFCVEYNIAMADQSTSMKISRHFVASAPPSALLEVEKEVRSLTRDTIKEGQLNCSFRANYLKFQAPLAPIGPSSTPCQTVALQEAVLAAGDESSGCDLIQYSDPEGVLMCGNAHYRLGAIELIRPAPTSSCLEATRRKLLACLRAHVAATHAHSSARQPGRVLSQGCEVLLIEEAATEAVFLLATSAGISSASNFFSGAFFQNWKLTISFPGAPSDRAKSSSFSLQGVLRLHSHVYEAGNTQLKNEKTVLHTEVASPVWPHVSDVAFAGMIIGCMAAEEDAFQEAIEAAAESLSSSLLKELRRFLPTTGQKFDWTAPDKHRLRLALQKNTV
jgi:F-actin capping protein alpha subunit